MTIQCDCKPLCVSMLCCKGIYTCVLLFLAKPDLCVSFLLSVKLGVYLCLVLAIQLNNEERAYLVLIAVSQQISAAPTACIFFIQSNLFVKSICLVMCTS